MGGSNIHGQSGVYGTLGTASAANIPGSREDAMSWTDKSGNLWLFGGAGTDSAGFFSKKEIDEYLAKLEEAKKRDHRKLGKELDLFSIQDLAGPGLIFFHPKGGIVRRQIEDWMRDQYIKRGYSLVYTPHVMRSELWKTSGHYDFFGDNMFKRMELDDAEYQLKPMNCPGHILIY